MRFRVRRARDMGHGYAHGWFVIDQLGHFRLFATWAEAQAYAHALSRIVNAEAVCA